LWGTKKLDMDKNSSIINDFLSEKGLTKKKLSELLYVDRKTLYWMINKPGEKGIRQKRINDLNTIFKKYNYTKRVG
jgi:predicted transcriptional regulator